MKELLIPPKGMYTQCRSIDKCALSRKCFFSLRIPTYHCISAEQISVNYKAKCSLDLFNPFTMLSGDLNIIY